MNDPVKAYPLAWPAAWRRTPEYQRRRAQFHTTKREYSSTQGGGSWLRKSNLSVSEATSRVLAELTRMGVRGDDLVISTNLKLRLDGLPRSDQRMPEDPGVAVYWADVRAAQLARRCMAVDMYDRVEHNLAAIAATLEAMRAIERHGGAEILDRAFTGFTALPAPVMGQKPWRETLGFGAAAEVSPGRLEAAYRTLRSQHHPDKGGEPEAFQAVQQAYEAGMRELGNPA